MPLAFRHFVGEFEPQDPDDYPRGSKQFIGKTLMWVEVLPADLPPQRDDAIPTAARLVPIPIDDTKAPPFEDAAPEDVVARRAGDPAQVTA